MNPVRSFLAVLSIVTVFFSEVAFADKEKKAVKRPPNVILIVADDLGYRDLSCYGAKDFSTPNIDQLAFDGVRLTSFYAAASIGSPSRAAMLTARYPVRMKFEKNPAPKSGKGLKSSEFTLAELLKTKDYVTACFGKWGLGDNEKHLPNTQGFDEYFGIPYSNDLGWWQGKPEGFNKKFPPIPFIDSTAMIEENPDQRYLTQRYTDHSMRFIREHQKEPFFLYLAYSAPHVPLFVSEKFSGSADYGLYGDVMQEMDWSVGEILKTLKETEIDENTLIIFTSDNGPALAQGSHGGKSDPLRDGKFTRFEGGHRVPCIVRLPKKFKGGIVLPGIVTGMDLFPTIANLAGTEPHKGTKIDGIDMTEYFSGKVKNSPRSTFFYSKWSVRHDRWKLMMPGGYREEFPKPTETYEPGMVKYDHHRLFDLFTDVSETNSQHADEDHAELIKKLADLCYDFQGEFAPPAPKPETEPKKK